MTARTPSIKRPTRTRAALRKLLVASAIAATSAAPLMGAGAAHAATSTSSAPAGCSYGTGGPLADSLCWIDMSAFGTLTGAEIRGSSVTKPMSIQVGAYTATFDITVSASSTGSVGLTSAAFGTDIWPRAILGNVIDGSSYYTGVVGKPALYELDDPSSPYAIAGPRETVTLDNLVVTNSSGHRVGNYSLVMTDAESTNTDEGFVWTSDVPLNKLQEVMNRPRFSAASMRGAALG